MDGGVSRGLPRGVGRPVGFHLDGRPRRTGLHVVEAGELGQELAQPRVVGKGLLHLLGEGHRLGVLVELHQLDELGERHVAGPADPPLAADVDRAQGHGGGDHHRASRQQADAPHRMWWWSDERRTDVGRAPDPALRLPRQATDDEVAPAPIEARTHGVRRPGSLVETFRRRSQGRLSGEGQLAGEHLVHDHAQRVDVGGRGHAAAGDLLGGHVFRGPDHPRGPGEPGFHTAGLQRTGDAKVGDDHARGGARPFPRRVAALHEEHVAALEVPVDHALGVRRGQAVAHLDHERQRLGRSHPAALLEVTGERLPLQELHSEEMDRDALGGPGVVELEHVADVGVRHPPGEEHLPAEALQGGGLGEERAPDDLQGHPRPEAQVLGLVDGTHAATGDEADDGEAPGEQLVRTKSRKVRVPVASGKGDRSHEVLGALLTRDPDEGGLRFLATRSRRTLPLLRGTGLAAHPPLPVMRLHGVMN